MSETTPAPDFGRKATMVANKTAGLVHVVYGFGTSSDYYTLCHATKRDIGRTVVGEVDGYRPSIAFVAPEGMSMCRECVQACKSIQRDQESHWRKVQSEGAAAGRTIVHEVTIRIVEHVGEEATLYSMKNSRERLEHALHLDPKSYDYLGKQFTKRDRFEFSVVTNSEFVEA